MGVGAPVDRRMEHTWQIDVSGISRLTGERFRCILAPYTCADELISGYFLHSVVC